VLPDDPAIRLRCYRNALSNWNFEGYVKFEERPAQAWLKSELPNHTLRGIAEQMYQYVKSGGVIDEQPETRPEYTSYEYHYDLRVSIGARRIYFETILICEDPDDPDDPFIVVVNVHDV
jgi:hypothetical protein